MAGNATRKFHESGYNQGISYHNRGTYPTKRAADTKAALFRAKNHCARVVRHKEGYTVYSVRR